jgi:hypothetical protein
MEQQYQPGQVTEILIYPGSSSFFPGQTPFGIYDEDYRFTEDAPKMALWCARRLGYPIQNVELIDENFYACFEEATSEYSAQVNQFNIRNDLYSLKGRPSGTNYSQKLVEGSILPHIIQISDAYGTLVGAGGNTEIKKFKIPLVAGQQVYDLNQLISEVSESGNRIDVMKVYNDPVPAINRFFDPYSVSGQGTLNLIDEFGFGSYSPAAQFVLMPIYEDLLRIQQIEFNDQFRKSAYTFNIVDNKITIFPRPTSTSIRNVGSVFLDYTVRQEFITNSTSVKSDVVADYSNVGYDFITYGSINDVGKQWIRKYTLALVKEMLGAIREKYSNIPIPGAEISLDGAALRSEAQTEKDNLMEQLRETLEELSRKVQFENKANEAKQQQEMLQKVPLAIYIG